MMRMPRKMPNLTHAQELVTLRTGRELSGLLHEMYVERGLSQVAMAAELGVSRLTIAMWLREHGISRDDRGPVEIPA